MSMSSPPATNQPATSKGPLIVAVLVVTLLILHQDNWFWTSETLVFGFMPIALFYHACISIAASATWFLATKIAWPVDAMVPQMNATGHEADATQQGEN